MDNFITEPFITLANQLADAARAIVRPHYRAPVLVEDKPNHTPVTAVDRAVEAEIKRLIAHSCPDHGFIGEETEPHQPEAEYVWVIDPIDGTKSFLCGIPMFGTLIALTHRGTPILGVIEQPVTGERWLGARGWPTTLNGAPVAARISPGLDGARLCATTPHMFTGWEKAAFERVRGAVKMTMYGTDCYAFGLLACGLVDLIVEADLSPHDYFSHVPIVQGAGGVITDWAGRALTLELGASQVVAAGDRALHEAALAVLRGDGAGPGAGDESSEKIRSENTHGDL